MVKASDEMNPGVDLTDEDIDDLADEWENAGIYEQEIALSQFEKEKGEKR